MRRAEKEVGPGIELVGGRASGRAAGTACRWTVERCKAAVEVELSWGNFFVIHVLLANIDTETDAVVSLDPACVASVLEDWILVDEGRITIPEPVQ